LDNILDDPRWPVGICQYLEDAEANGTKLWRILHVVFSTTLQCKRDSRCCLKSKRNRDERGRFVSPLSTLVKKPLPISIGPNLNMAFDIQKTVFPAICKCSFFRLATERLCLKRWPKLTNQSIVSQSKSSVAKSFISAQYSLHNVQFIGHAPEGVQCMLLKRNNCSQTLKVQK
jgi:hypothetical protein